ncbi:MAG: hypothetical protein FWD89_00030 [Firmicutes bacterium]|nr:hypothetical protein [Bacillota bacterium]MCL2770690.1 hypothetical protein [Bacillota bacterium]
MNAKQKLQVLTRIIGILSGVVYFVAGVLLIIFGIYFSLDYLWTIGIIVTIFGIIHIILFSLSIPDSNRFAIKAMGFGFLTGNILILILSLIIFFLQDEENKKDIKG